MTQTKWVVAVVLAVLIVGGVWFFVGGQQRAAPSAERPVVQQNETPVVEDVENVTVDLRVSRQGFSPDVVEASYGDWIVFRARSVDGLDHGLAIPFWNVSARLPAGETVVVRIRADKRGWFSFYSNVASHPNAGSLEGRIHITE